MQALDEENRKDVIAWLSQPEKHLDIDAILPAWRSNSHTNSIDKNQSPEDNLSFHIDDNLLKRKLSGQPEVKIDDQVLLVTAVDYYDNGYYESESQTANVKVSLYAKRRDVILMINDVAIYTYKQINKVFVGGHFNRATDLATLQTHQIDLLSDSEGHARVKNTDFVVDTFNKALQGNETSIDMLAQALDISANKVAIDVNAIETSSLRVNLPNQEAVYITSKYPDIVGSIEALNGLFSEGAQSISVDGFANISTESIPVNFDFNQSKNMYRIKTELAFNVNINDTDDSSESTHPAIHSVTMDITPENGISSIPIIMDTNNTLAADVFLLQEKQLRHAAALFGYSDQQAHYFPDFEQLYDQSEVFSKTNNKTEFLKQVLLVNDDIIALMLRKGQPDYRLSEVTSDNIANMQNWNQYLAYFIAYAISEQYTTETTPEEKIITIKSFFDRLIALNQSINTPAINQNFYATFFDAFMSQSSKLEADRFLRYGPILFSTKLYYHYRGLALEDDAITRAIAATPVDFYQPLENIIEELKKLSYNNGKWYPIGSARDRIGKIPELLTEDHINTLRTHDKLANQYGINPVIPHIFSDKDAFRYDIMIFKTAILGMLDEFITQDKHRIQDIALYKKGLSIFSNRAYKENWNTETYAILEQVQRYNYPFHAYHVYPESASAVEKFIWLAVKYMPNHYKRLTRNTNGGYLGDYTNVENPYALYADRLTKIHHQLIDKVLEHITYISMLTSFDDALAFGLWQQCSINEFETKLEVIEDALNDINYFYSLRDESDNIEAIILALKDCS